MKETRSVNISPNYKLIWETDTMPTEWDKGLLVYCLRSMDTQAVAQIGKSKILNRVILSSLKYTCILKQMFL